MPDSPFQPVWPNQLILTAVDRPAFQYAGIRKIVQGVNWEFPADDYPSLKYEDLGYGRNKHGQLMKNYFNPEEVERCRQLLSKRNKKGFTSVALMMRNGTKDARSQGHCMLSLVVSKTRQDTVVEVQYRSTELVLKFGGDLVFIPFVVKALEVEPTRYRFHFANAYLSGVYFPTLCHHWNGGRLEFLDYLYRHDRAFFQTATRFFLRSSYRRDQFFPYSPENLQHRFGWARLNMPVFRKFLEPKHKEFGVPLPKIHHVKGEYIPRGKREDDDSD